MLPEKLDERRQAGEVEPLSDLLNRKVRGLKEHLRFDQDCFVQPVKDRAAGGFLDSCRKVLGSYVQFVGVEFYSPVFFIIDCKQVEELVRQVI